MKNKTLKKRFYFIASHLTLIFAFAVSISAQTTEFTYQGKLTDTGTLTATYDFEFRLCNSLAADCTTPLATQQKSGVPVSGGVFTVTLDFGAANFDGTNRWLEIAVKRPLQAGFTTLTPRQPLTSAPYSIKSLKSFDAENLGGTAANLFVQIADPRLTDDRNPLPNSPNYIQNTILQQALSNFNITGDGIIGGNSIIGGNLGIGITPSATIKLDVNGRAIIRPGGSGGAIVFGNPNGETGLTINEVGTNRADIRFDNSTLKLVVGPPGGPPSSTNGIVIGTNGKVGIGTGFLPFKLNIDGGNGGIGVYSTTIGGLGVNGIDSGGGDGVEGDSTNGRGVVGTSNSGIGVFAQSFSGNAIYANGTIAVAVLGTAGSTTLCRNASQQIATCSSSLRYKKDFQPFGDGLGFINQLRPISFKWKADNMLDIGFGAEDVAQINPLFVTYNDKGEVEGVKYDRLSVVFVNAFKEQQAQIEQQKSQIEQQQQQINGLKEIVCGLQPQAKICH